MDWDEGTELANMLAYKQYEEENNICLMCNEPLDDCFCLEMFL